MKFEDIKIGQHLWAISRNQLIMVAKFDDEGFQVCGDWECGINYNDCQIIELVDFPKGYENVKLFYLYD